MSTSPGVWTCLSYRDAEAARQFLTEVFGFTERLVVHDDSGTQIVHAELAWPEGGGLMFGSLRDRGAKGTAEPVPGTQWVYVVTADPDTVLKRAAAAGARIVGEPEDTDYGSRNITLADPEDNTWTFGTYAGA